MKKTYSVSEAARLLGYSTNSVYSFLKRGDIKSVRLGKGKFRIPQAEIDRLLAREPIEIDVDQEVNAEPAVSEPLRLNVPRPGKSLSELGSDKPFRTILLWFQERAGLPSLFDWFVALSSIVLGISLFIYNKQLDSLLVGRFALWFTPIKIALLCGGVGLILADMLRDETPMFKNFNNIFRYILAATFLGLAFIQLQSNDADGFLIDGLFALVILVEVMFGVISSTAYMFYLLGLMVEISLIVYLYPGNSGLSEISATVSKLTGGSTWIFGVLSILVVALSVFGYFWNKMVLKIVLGIAGIAMVALSLYYVNIGYYARSFFILITGMIGMLLPFWEQFKQRYEDDRTLTFRMFGIILMAFSLAVLIVGSVQTVLINNGIKNLSEKTDFARVTVEAEMTNAQSTLMGLTQNSLFIKAFDGKKTADLNSFLKAIFNNNKSFNNVVITDLSGKALAEYPESSEFATVDFSKDAFFNDVVSSGKSYVSQQIDYFSPDLNKAIVVAIPVADTVGGKVLGVAIVTYSADYLTSLMQTIAVTSEGQVITLVDSGGKWIIFPDTAAIGTAVAESDATYNLWNQSSGRANGFDRFGQYSMFVSEKSNNLDWSVVVSQPMSTALDVSRSGLALILFLLLAASITVVFSYIFSKNNSLLNGKVR